MAASQPNTTPGLQICAFCQKNGEQPSFFTSHSLKIKVGRKYTVTCPILRRYVCVECGGTGDNAHTISHCPLRKQRGETTPSIPMLLKKTKVKSNGHKRY